MKWKEEVTNKRNKIYKDIRRSFVQCLTSSHRQQNKTKNKKKVFKCEREKEDEGKTLCCLGEEINSPKNKRNTKYKSIAAR